MVSISELCDEHRKLEVLAAKLMTIVAAPVADAAAVAGVRWQLAQALLDHCRHEDAAIYDRMLASGDRIATDLAWRFRNEFGALSAAYAGYISDWPVDRINRNWVGFQADTLALLAKLGRRIASEEGELYLHAERVAARRKAA